MAWFSSLMLRDPRDVPSRLKGVWWSCWGVALAMFVVLLAALISGKGPTFLQWAALGTVGGTVWTLCRSTGTYFGLQYAGDAARYLNRRPENVGVRQTIRAAAIELLEKLHDDPSWRRYDRIIVVGHSLGSVIAYDALTHLWQRRHHPKQTFPVSSDGDADDSTEDYRGRQAAMWRKQRAMGVQWKITDFVTLGSPLAHTQFLMASSGRDFEQRKTQREYPTCPPQAEDDRDWSYGGDLLKTTTGGRFLHHAALFACTRWTNLHFDRDIIGGEILGLGGEIRNERLEPRGVFPHTKYWAQKDDPQLLAALDLPGWWTVPSNARVAIDAQKRETRASGINHLGPLTPLAAAYLNEVSAEDTATALSPELRRREAENDVIAASLAIKRSRARRIPLSDVERRLVAQAVAHVQSGIQPPATFAPIPRGSQRVHRTMLSLADPGMGHLTVTLADPDLLDGVIVHHEVISRCVADDARPDIAPYRMIDIRQNGVIRLHAADDVPVSVYAGRPSCQMPVWSDTPPVGWTVADGYSLDPVTPGHLAAAAASAAFANGVADVKFCLSGLTAAQAVDFMARIRSAVDRDSMQTLSSQFNLNVAILNDLPSASAVNGSQPLVSEPVAIARLATELTQAAGWERVTLDSASASIPSRPVTDVLGFEALAGWVRHAHALGLETYISGGMSARHIEQATLAGVDGVGIGFWIHRPGDTPRGVGDIDADRIREAIRVRNAAEAQSTVRPSA